MDKAYSEFTFVLTQRIPHSRLWLSVRKCPGDRSSKGIGDFRSPDVVAHMFESLVMWDAVIRIAEDVMSDHEEVADDRPRG